MIRNFLHHWWMRNRYVPLRHEFIVSYRGELVSGICCLGIPLLFVIICESIVWKIFDVHFLAGNRVDYQDFPIYFASSWGNDSFFVNFLIIIAAIFPLYTAIFVENFFENLHIPNGKF